MKATLNQDPDILPFGKYKGSTIDEIMDEDPAYLGWCIAEGIEFMDNLTDEQKEIAEEALEEMEFKKQTDIESDFGHWDDQWKD